MDTTVMVERMKKALADKHMSLRDLAEKIGYDHGNLSRLLSGKRRWTLPHLQTVCEGLGLNIQDLMPSLDTIPIVAVLDAAGSFEYTHALARHSVLGSLPLPSLLKTKGSMEAKDFYAIKLHDTIGSFVGGSTLICKHRIEIKNGDYVICSRESGRGILGKVMLDKQAMTLRHCMEDTPLPATHTRLCDKVLAVLFP